MTWPARLTLALLALAAVGGVGWRVAHEPRPPVAVPPPCVRPVAVAGAARAPGVVCLDPGAGADEALRVAGAWCSPSATLPRAVAAGDRLTVVRDAAGCRLAQDRLPALALRTLRVRIDPNRATEAELRALPGIGPALAHRIAESRRVDGPFRSADDLRRVRGLGQRTLERLRHRLEVTP